MTKKQSQQDQQHQCHSGPDQEIADAGPDTKKEPTDKEIAEAADKAEARDKEIATEGNELLEQLQEISRLQYRAIIAHHVRCTPLSRICIDLRITPDRLQIEIAAGFKTLFHLAIEDDDMGYFTKQAERYAQQQAADEAEAAKKQAVAAKK